MASKPHDEKAAQPGQGGAVEKKSTPHNDASNANDDSETKELYPMVNWKYDLFLYVVGNLVDTFFREVVPRGSWRVPQSGPVLFVAAPHANQVS